jgi:hypothetical protein
MPYKKNPRRKNQHQYFFQRSKRKLLCSVMLAVLLHIGSKSAFCQSLVDIGEGRKMYMECIRSGSPTTILIAGYTERGDSSWNTFPPGQAGSPVFFEVGKFTRVCTYDRPGTIGKGFEKSRSDPIP